jgi:hypothetical protein
MNSVPEGTWFTRYHITGPAYLWLTVAISDKPIDNLTVEVGSECPDIDTLPPTDVAEAVTRGAAKANQQYQSNFHPAAIKYSTDTYNALSRIEYVTFKILEAAALPAFASKLQAAIENRPSSFHKLSVSTGVSKSILSRIAKTGDSSGTENDVIVELLKYFKLVHEQN